MTSIESVREVINKHFQHVEDLGNGVLRGERIHKDKPYAVAYVDLSDSIVERSRDLTEFQESLLGAGFFAPDNDLRWNSYLYFLAGPKSVANDDFIKAKAHIEADRHFARKLVLDADDLVRRLGESRANESREPALVADTGATWASLLRKASLGVLLEQQPRTRALELIANGAAFKAEAATTAPAGALKKDVLASGLLRKLTIGTFRRVNKGKSFEFGDVNLIVGANGTGKTSLLEAIEVLYCGRVRRDPDAPFSDIVGLLDNGQGKLEKVKATTVAATLKTRNTLWYGRSDHQANAISQGFTRFNFLDTDAAFRLSSDSSRDDIKEDLGRLLVGPETSKLWDYLSKLADDVKTRLRTLSDRLPSQRKAVELLTEEVKRLREAPSEASTLLNVYRASLAQLSASWPTSAASDALEPNERVRLEALVRSTTLILSSVPETPVTREKVERRVTSLRETVASAKDLHQKYDASVKKANEATARAKTHQARQTHLEQWMHLLDVGVPTLAANVREAEGRVAKLRSALRGQPSETPPTVPPEFAQLGISDALDLAREKHEAAQEQEKAAELALSHSLQLGQSLDALRRDLHDTSVAYIERSGESALCPVCKTEHTPSELLVKLDALIASDGSRASDSLRRNAQLAREHRERCRQAEAQLSALAAFAQASGAEVSTPAGKLQDDLHQAGEDLRAAAAELETQRAALGQLSLQGVDWTGWEQSRDSIVVPLLPVGADPVNAEVVKAALDAVREQADADAKAAADERDLGTDLARRIAELTSGELKTLSQSLGPAQHVTSLERLLQRAEGAQLEVAGLSEFVPMSVDATVESLERHLEACLMAYDKALHALQREAQAKATLQKKERELATATESVAKDATARHNLVRASEALSTIVQNHSLERETADAFGSIKGKVSAVFAQIHSPPEYELGDFSNDSLIVRRDNGQRHAVNQVSAGQRAALALSIFLALNDSAKTAPPVILIDDPVAHIDDLNALSFLDYLREVALRSRRQVFFATADIRLAALFQRKFEFMGGDRFKRIALSQETGAAA